MPRSLRLAAVVGVAALGAAACGSSHTSSAPAPKSTTPVSAAASSASAVFAPVPKGTVLNVGDQQQDDETLFKDSGVEAELPFKVNFVQFASGPLVTAGFASNHLDIGQMGDLPAALTVSDKLPLRAIAMVRSVGSSPSEYLLAKPGIDSVADLRGQSVAYTTGTAEQAFALRALAQGGLTQADVHQVDVTLEQLLDVLQSGSVAASVVTANEAQIYLQAHPTAKALATNLTVRPSIYEYWLATASALANPAKKAAIEDFVKGLLLAGNWAYEHKANWAKDYYVDVQDETPAQADLGIDAGVDETWVPYTSGVSAALADVVRLEVQAGAIKSSFSLAPLYSDTSWLSSTYAKIIKEVPQDAS